MIKYLSIFLFVMLSIVTNAQNLKIFGYLNDSLTKNPLPYSNIILSNAQDSVLGGTMTDEKGSFKIQLKKDVGLQFKASSLGYEELVFPIESIEGNVLNLGDLYLKTNTEILGEVNISAQNTVVQKFDRKVFGINENKKAAAKDIFDLLRTLPGVVVDDDNNVRYKGTIASVMVDNMSAQYLYPDLEMIPVANVDKIELIDASMRSGGNGKGGIINIKMKSVNDDGMSGVASSRLSTADFNNINRLSGYLNANYKKGKLLIFNNLWSSTRNNNAKSRQYGSSSFDNQVFPFTDDSEYDNNFTYIMDYIGVQYEVTPKSKIMITLGLQDSYGSGESDNNYVQSLEDEILNSYKNVSVYDYSNLKSNLYAKFRHTFDTTDREFTAYLYSNFPSFKTENTSLNSYDYIVQDFNTTDDSASFFTKKANKEYSIYSGMYYNHPINDKSRWNANYTSYVIYYLSDSTDYYVNNVYYLPQSESYNGIDLSQSLSLRYGSTFGKWKFDAGINQEYNHINIDYVHYFENEDTVSYISKDFYNILPSATVMFNVDSSQDIKLSYSRTVNTPYFSQLDAFVNKRSPYSWSSGNSDLKAVSYNNIYLGYTYNQAMWNVSAELFYSLTNNEIDYFSYPISEILSMTLPDNIAYQSRLGVDLSSYLSIKGKYNFSLSSSIYHSTLDASNLSESFENIGVSVNDVVKKNYGFNVKLSTDVKLAKNTSAVIYVNYYSREVSFDGYEFERLRSSLGLTQRFFDRSLRASVGVSNLFDDMMDHGSYTDNLGYESTTDNYYSTYFCRMYYISLKYRFRQGDRNTSSVGQK